MMLKYGTSFKMFLIFDKLYALNALSYPVNIKKKERKFIH